MTLRIMIWIHTYVGGSDPATNVMTEDIQSTIEEEELVEKVEPVSKECDADTLNLDKVANRLVASAVARAVQRVIMEGRVVSRAE